MAQKPKKEIPPGGGLFEPPHSYTRHSFTRPRAHMITGPLYRVFSVFFPLSWGCIVCLDPCVIGSFGGWHGRAWRAAKPPKIINNSNNYWPPGHLFGPQFRPLKWWPTIWTLVLLLSEKGLKGGGVWLFCTFVSPQRRLARSSALAVAGPWSIIRGGRYYWHMMLVSWSESPAVSIL